MHAETLSVDLSINDFGVKTYLMRFCEPMHSVLQLGASVGSSAGTGLSTVDRARKKNLERDSELAGPLRLSPPACDQLFRPRRVNSLS